VKTRAFILITVLAVIFGGTAALADEHDEAPEDNTSFTATVSDESLDDTVTDDDETLYIRYHVCSLDEEADDFCDDVLENFDPDAFEDWTGEVAVEPNGSGEFNHGSFVSAFAQGFEGTGKGCILRFVAGSDWGKEGFDLEGEDVLLQAETHCSFNADHGNGNGNGRPEGAGQGKPPWAGPDGDKSLKPGKGGADD